MVNNFDLPFWTVLAIGFLVIYGLALVYDGLGITERVVEAARRYRGEETRS